MAKTSIRSETALAGLPDRPDITVHQLRVFWTIVYAGTLTRAAKQLGLAQPSLSQQLAKLEKSLGTPLFHRRTGEMVLTEAGEFLLPRAEQVLRLVDDLGDGLAEYSGGQRATLRIAGVSSMLRVLLPRAAERLRAQFPTLSFDLHEAAPADILEMLYGRQVTVGLVSASSIAPSSVGFLQVSLAQDPYVLMVPESLDLGEVRDPARDLAPQSYATLRRSIQFSFGTPHTRRVEDWYGRLVPGSTVAAQCRSFELAISLVQAGVGVCLAPAFSALVGARQIEGIRLYAANVPGRELVALIPSQYRRRRLYSALVDELRTVAQQMPALTILPAPPFMRAAPDD